MQSTFITCCVDGPSLEWSIIVSLDGCLLTFRDGIDTAVNSELGLEGLYVTPDLLGLVVSGSSDVLS